jgi:hypothetical protein
LDFKFFRNSKKCEFKPSQIRVFEALFQKVRHLYGTFQSIENNLNLSNFFYKIRFSFFSEIKNKNSEIKNKKK